MAYPARWVVGTTTSGNLNTLVAGTTTPGQALLTNDIALGSLSCHFTVLADTNTITITCLWQVSMDGTTWYDLRPENGAALVVAATGTAGADTAIDLVLLAPDAILGWKRCRPAVRNGVVTGATIDTYSMINHYRKYNGFA